MPQYTIYTLPRFFKSGSKLHQYLATKRPHLIKPDKDEYTLYDVLLALRQVIAKEKLYDPCNVTVIWCDRDLEEALDVHAAHVTEIRDLVISQMQVADESSLNSLETKPHSPANDTNNSVKKFDKNGWFRVKREFADVLRMTSTFPKRRIHTYKEICAAMSEYILEPSRKKANIDARNVRILKLSKDPLGKALKINLLHRSQESGEIQKNIKRASTLDKLLLKLKLLALNCFSN